MAKKAILISGNVNDGFVFTGPFDDINQAIEHAEDFFEGDWNVGELQKPEEKKRVVASWLIKSFTDKNKTYYVTLYSDGHMTCECDNFNPEKGNNSRCKHIQKVEKVS